MQRITAGSQFGPKGWLSLLPDAVYWDLINTWLTARDNIVFTQVCSNVNSGFHQNVFYWRRAFEDSPNFPISLNWESIKNYPVIVRHFAIPAMIYRRSSSRVDDFKTLIEVCKPKLELSETFEKYKVSMRDDFANQWHACGLGFQLPNHSIVPFSNYGRANAAVMENQVVTHPPFMGCTNCVVTKCFSSQQAIKLWAFTDAQLMQIPYWRSNTERYYRGDDLAFFRQNMPFAATTLEAEASVEIINSYQYLPPIMKSLVTLSEDENLPMPPKKIPKMKTNFSEAKAAVHSSSPKKYILTYANKSVWDEMKFRVSANPQLMIQEDRQPNVGSGAGSGAGPGPGI